MDMETIGLRSITINNDEHRFRALGFRKADLVIVTQYGDKLWYIDAEGIDDAALLASFGQSEDLRVELLATAESGETWTGIGYLHPNERNSAAAIRGEGPLTQA
ncbi:NADAR family protein [Paenibacillus soyae]|uniref:NADAR family protein n=1 Tax=Paenibacillus soyae TaxID=2969249 RepID=A0A9X2MMM0_9BACL|nr:NADAR family protein [Paenibacillus soyae]MCR2802426.1 NADAR family protein [Paenibacillus soyae]